MESRFNVFISRYYSIKKISRGSDTSLCALGVHMENQWGFSCVGDTHRSLRSIHAGSSGDRTTQQRSQNRYKLCLDSNISLKFTGNRERNITKSLTHVFQRNVNNMRLYLIGFMLIPFLLPKLYTRCKHILLVRRNRNGGATEPQCWGEGLQPPLFQ